MRLDLLLWMVGGGSALVGGMLNWRQACQRGVRGRGTSDPLMTALPIGLGLSAVLAGLGWRRWQTGAWPGGLAAEALALLAFGALLAILWQPGREHSLASAFSLMGTGVLLCGLVISGVAGGLPAAQPQARGWLFGLRNLLVGVGTGGWLPLLADSLLGLWAERQGRITLYRLSWPDRSVLRFCYPWLTAACLADVAWNLAAHAMPWRIASADLWLTVTWLLGAVYLHAVWARQAPRLSFGLLSAIALVGLTSALLAAWQAATLF